VAVDLELDGKVILVTGGSDGLGRALCRTLVAEGARVAMCARDGDRLEDATTEIRAHAKTSGRVDPGEVLGVVADVMVPADLGRFVDAAVDRFGDRIDGLVNNAGRSAAKRIAETTDTDWDDDLQLKLYAAVRLTRLVLPHLARPGGAIVNVLAVAAKTPGAGSGPSSVSRAAGMALTKTLSRELGPEGIRVNSVLVGLIESGQWDRVAAARNMPVGALYEQMATDAGIPLGRVGGPGEFADVVTYLLSSRASYVTGVALNLDGGLCQAV